MELVQDYLKAAEIDSELVVDYRFTERPHGFGPLSWTGEVDVDNGFVRYTRVFKMWFDDKMWFRTKSITMKTRLHVPVNEVPEGASVYFADDGSGPFMVFPSGEIGLYAVADEHGIRRMLTPDEKVAVEFYYAKGEGAMAGGVLFCTEQKLLEWCQEHYGEDDVSRLVGGCKFELWALSHLLFWEEPSVFDMPPATTIEAIRKHVQKMVDFARWLDAEYNSSITLWAGPLPANPHVYTPETWERYNEPLCIIWDTLIRDLEEDRMYKEAQAARDLEVSRGLLTAEEFAAMA